jgi:membrane-associated phospholipid phosphatase
MNTSETVANILSYVLSPTVFAFYVILIFLLFPPLHHPENIFVNLLLAIIFICIFPVLMILYFKQKGKVDIWVSNQDQRLPFYLVAIIGYILGSIIFYLRGETTLFVLSVAYAGVTSAVTIGNFSTKVSSHSAGVAGPLLAVTLVYGVLALPSFLLLPLVFWSRLKLNAHSLTQLTLGTIIGMVVTFFVYVLLYPTISIPIIS